MLSHVQLFATPWTVVHQAPLSMEFSRQEYWSGLPFPSPGDFLSQELNPGLLHCRQILYHLIHQVTFWLKPALSLAPAHVHAVDWLEINTPPGMLTNPSGPLLLPGTPKAFLASLLSAFLGQLFYTFSIQTFQTSSFILTLSWWHCFLFLWENRSSQKRISASSHDHINPPTCICDRILCLLSCYYGWTICAPS